MLAGEGGSDKITVPSFTNANSDDSITIFGDWGYGDEGSRYTGTQYGDTRLEKKLWGDSDIIDIGVGDGFNEITVYAGDGDDYIETEEGHYDKNIFGGRGNDEIRWGGGDDITGGTHQIFGGLGDDLIGPTTVGTGTLVGES